MTLRLGTDTHTPLLPTKRNQTKRFVFFVKKDEGASFAFAAV